MKNYLIMFLLFFACNSVEKNDSETIIVKNFDTTKTKKINIDSVYNMAQQTVRRYKEQIQNNQQCVDSLSNAITQTKHLSEQDKDRLIDELQNTKRQQNSYETELNAYKTKRKIQKDTIIYNIRYIDSIIYRRDTITIYDTIIKTIFRKKNRK